MSWATCYSGSNNINFNYPPIMADGRNYASWQPDAVVNQKIINQANITNNFNYRKYLQNNSDQIMKYNMESTCYDVGLPAHVNTNATPSSNVPHKYRNVFDTSNPGFGYSNSDLKNPYLSREQLNARLVAPTIDPTNFKT
jgi:hypothetical protein